MWSLRRLESARWVGAPAWQIAGCKRGMGRICRMRLARTRHLCRRSLLCAISRLSLRGALMMRAPPPRPSLTAWGRPALPFSRGGETICPRSAVATSAARRRVWRLLPPAAPGTLQGGRCRPCTRYVRRARPLSLCRLRLRRRRWHQFSLLWRLLLHSPLIWIMPIRCRSRRW